MRKNDRGFTLIELIVTISIIAIFSGVILTLITSGSSAFRSTSGNTKVQVNAQATLDQIQELVIDANRSVYYASGTADAAGGEIKNDIDSSADGSGDRTFYVCNTTKHADGTMTNVCDRLEWSAADERLYYSQVSQLKSGSDAAEGDSTGAAESFNSGTWEKGPSADADSAAQEPVQDSPSGNLVYAGGVDIAGEGKVLSTAVTAARAVFAEHITDFRADVTKVEEQRIVRFSITAVSGGKEINTLHSVNLRNRIKIAAPDDAFGGEDGIRGSIKITGAPQNMDAGTAVMLGAYTEGNVDPATIVWVVVSGDGSFPAADSAYGKLTADSNASGSITVMVTAQLSDGTPIASGTVTIAVNNVRRPSGMVADTDRILLGAGAEYDLNDYVKWYEIYEDGTRVSDTALTNITWSGGGAGLTVTANGRVTADKSAGTDAGNGVFQIAASCTAENGTYSGRVTISLARLDLTAPTGTYYVGNEKPLAYVYREAGVQMTNVKPRLSFTQTPASGGTYYVGDEFEENDVGQWTISAAVDVSQRGGYAAAAGTAAGAGSFEVQRKSIIGKADIILRDKNKDTVTEGGFYDCGYYNHYGFYLDYKHTEGTKWEIKWKVSGNSKAGTRLIERDAEKAELTVAEGEKGFILSAVATEYDSSSQHLLAQYSGEMKVKVMHRPVIVNPPESVRVRDEYKLDIYIPVTSMAGAEEKLPCTGKEVQVTMNSYWETVENDGWTWRVHSDNYGKVVMTARVKPEAIASYAPGEASDNHSVRKELLTEKEITVGKARVIREMKCKANKEVQLKVDEEDKWLQVQGIRTYYLKAGGSELTECNPHQIPILTLKDEDFKWAQHMKVKMGDGTNFEDCQYVLISVDLGEVVYDFYIYPDKK